MQETDHSGVQCCSFKCYGHYKKDCRQPKKMIVEHQIRRRAGGEGNRVSASSTIQSLRRDAEYFAQGAMRKSK